MRVLIDTNVLLRSAEPGHLHFQYSVDAINLLRQQGHELTIVPQVLYEFWSVATRPIAINGLGMSPDDAHAELNALSRLFRVLRDERGIYSIWNQLVVSYGVKGNGIMHLKTQQNLVDEFHRHQGNLNAEVQTIQKRQVELTKQRRRMQFQCAMLTAKLESRKISDRVQPGRWLFLLILPMVLSAICLILTDLITGNRSLCVLAGMLAFGTAASILIILLKNGDDRQLQPDLDETRKLSDQLRCFKTRYADRHSGKGISLFSQQRCHSGGVRWNGALPVPGMRRDHKQSVHEWRY